MRKVIKSEEGESLDIELGADLLRENERIAEENKKFLKEHGVIAIDVMGSVGSGKTTLIEKLVQRLKGKYKLAALDGDLNTTIDADLIGRHGVESIQINTGKECHLDANLVRKALKEMDLDDIDLIFIENVGNLICPSDFALGSSKRIVVISVTEGPYMVLKHPLTFARADLVVINKIDLAGAMGVDPDKLEKDAKKVKPEVKVVKTCLKAGKGVDEVIKALDLPSLLK
nr:hydrogenase nickel incorporation protein HypB [Candidatus Njordarchaeota archaeon]